MCWSLHMLTALGGVQLLIPATSPQRGLCVCALMCKPCAGGMSTAGHASCHCQVIHGIERWCVWGGMWLTGGVHAWAECVGGQPGDACPLLSPLRVSAPACVRACHLVRVLTSVCQPVCLSACLSVLYSCVQTMRHVWLAVFKENTILLRQQLKGASVWC